MWVEQIAVAKATVYAGLDPVDLKRCMGESKQPHQPFRIGFPEPRWERCDRIPVMVAIEARPDKLTKTRGAMSLCRRCSVECQKRRPEEFYIPAAPFKAAFKLGGHQAVRDMVYGHESRPKL